MRKKIPKNLKNQPRLKKTVEIKRTARTVLCLWAVFLSAASAGYAYEPSSLETLQKAGVEEVRVIFDPRAPSQEGFSHALLIRLRKGVKTYWKNPGIAGLPPTITFTPQKGAPQKATIAFPPPQRFRYRNIESVGYQGTVIFPFRLQGAARAKGTIEAFFLACDTLCFPIRRLLTVDFSARSPKDDSFILRRAVGRLPLSKPPPSLALRDVRLLKGEKGGWMLTLTLPPSAALQGSPDAFVDSEIPFGRGQLSYEKDQTVLSLPAARQAEKSQERPLSLDIVLTFRKSGALFAYETRKTVFAQKNPIRRTVWPWFLFGLLLIGAGLLLNAMPCSWPLLFIKAHYFTQTAPSARKSFFGIAAGQILFFTLLALLVSISQIQGSPFFLGTYLQSPLFLAMIALFLGLMFLGTFPSLSLPPFRAGAAKRLLAGSVMPLSEGFFTALVSMSCLAPFVASAFATAAGRPPAVVFGLFFLLGLGYSGPFWLMAFNPGARRLLQRLFPYRSVFYRLSQGFLLAAAVWFGLLSVKARTAGADILESFRPFSLEKITEDQNKGRIAFVHITAAWCLSCRFNEEILHHPLVAEFFGRHKNLSLYQGDWSREDPAIEAFLSRYHRSGIPLDIFLFPRRKAVILPPLLAPSDITGALVP